MGYSIILSFCGLFWIFFGPKIQWKLHRLRGQGGGIRVRGRGRRVPLEPTIIGERKARLKPTITFGRRVRLGPRTHLTFGRRVRLGPGLGGLGVRDH